MEWFRDHLWESWLIAAGVLGALEMLSLDLLFAMLAGGALVGAVVAGVSGSIILSAVFALVSAVAMLGLLRPAMMKRLHAAPSLKTGHHRMIGQQGVVTETIVAGGSGRISIDGQDWLAVGYDDEEIEVGRHVDVLEVSGATAKVLAVPQLDSNDNNQLGE